MELKKKNHEARKFCQSPPGINPQASAFPEADNKALPLLYPSSFFSLYLLLLPSTPFCRDSNQEIYTHKEQKPTGKQDANSLIVG